MLLISQHTDKRLDFTSVDWRISRTHKKQVGTRMYEYIILFYYKRLRAKRETSLSY